MPLLRVVADEVRDLCVQTVEGFQPGMGIGVNETQFDVDSLPLCRLHRPPLKGRKPRVFDYFIGYRLQQSDPNAIFRQPDGTVATAHLEAGARVELAYVLDEHDGAAADSECWLKSFRNGGKPRFSRRR